MEGDNLDARLEPFAEFLLAIIIIMMAAAVSSFVLMKVAQRRKEKAHNKLSASRRGKDSAINLLARETTNEAVPDEPGRSVSRKPRKRSGGFDLVGLLKQIAARLEQPKSRRRGKGRRGRRRSSSNNLHIDILKKPGPAVDTQRDPPAP